MAATIASVQLLFLLITIISGFSCHEAIKTERIALLKFKQGLTDPSRRLSSWVGEECCKWRGVLCNNRTGHVVKLSLRSVDDDGSEGMLGGEISDSLLDLKYLNYLDLSMNNFEGTRIPEFIGSMEKLMYLNVSGASFSGPIPPQLGNLSRLTHLDLKEYFGFSTDHSSQNDLHWILGLSSLRHLNLGGVNLSTASAYWLQAVSQLPSLSELHLPDCGLSVLPHSFPPNNFSSLSVLDLPNNGFNTTIPSWLFQLSNLVYLDLRFNNLRGTILDAFANSTSLERLRRTGSLCNLKTLILSQNNLHGEITELIDVLSGCNNCGLEYLNLGYNELDGFLPNSLGNLSNLQSLVLWENSFVGSIPNSIGKLSQMKELYLSQNQMNGIIPQTLGQLNDLVVVDLSGNSWEGVLTEAHFSNLTNLKELSIAKFTFLDSDVTLVINIHPEWIPPFKLRYLKLMSCRVGPKFPVWLRNQNELKTLVVTNAGISDTIPDWFLKLDLELDQLNLGYNRLSGRIPNSIKFAPQSSVYLSVNQFRGPLPLFSSNVSTLFLRNNSFSGPIPRDIGERMPMLTELNLSYNFLTGTLPASISELIGLMVLHVSNNNLSGEIPALYGVPNLVVHVDLSNNNLSGELPSSIGSLTFLIFLQLSNNNLSGELPSTMQNCTVLSTLDLGGNRLSGNIPEWIGETMPSLHVLRLRSNLFSGNIPLQLCTLSSLHVLDLAQNNLSGSIPYCVGNFSAMASEIEEYTYEDQSRLFVKGREDSYRTILYLVHSIDLSNNGLSGDLPEGLTNLSALGNLNLSMNHLTGKIPENIGSLRRLEALDLSRNQLSGPIPPGLASLTLLNHLNLSYNNLSGRIPAGNQLQALDDPSIYRDNPGLCGRPIMAKCPGDDGTLNPPGEDDEDGYEGHGDEIKWFYMSMGIGFVVGFWGVCGTLVIKESWRHAYFRLVHHMKEQLLLAVQLNVARLQKKLTLGRNQHST